MLGYVTHFLLRALLLIGAVWTPRSAYWLGVNLNLLVFERVFVGLDLCHNTAWVRW